MDSRRVEQQEGEQRRAADRLRAGVRPLGQRRALRTGTLEAVAESAKDGSLDCLVQVRVGLNP